MILNHAEKKIRYFNKIAVHYEVVYHYVVRRREETKEIYDSDFLDDITAGLISFDMQRMMGNEKYMVEGNKAWASHLENALTSHRHFLDSLRRFKLQDMDLYDPDLQQGIISIFEALANPGHEGLNRRKKGEGFNVGASKILHFMILDLFTILDSNARRELAKFHGFPRYGNDGAYYIKSMQCYQSELRG